MRRSRLDRVRAWTRANPATFDRLVVAAGLVVGAFAGIQRVYGESIGFDSVAVVAGTTLTVGGVLYWSRRRTRARAGAGESCARR